MRTALTSLLSCIVCVFPPCLVLAEVPEANSLKGLEHRLKILQPEDANVQKSVIDDLQLTKDQLIRISGFVEEVEAFKEKQGRQYDSPELKRTQFNFAQTVMRRMKAILNEKQVQRISELELQSFGASALARGDVIGKLKIKAAQYYRLEDAREDSWAMRQNPDDSPAFGHACFQILTDDQRKTWNEMIGPPLTTIASKVLIVAPSEPIPDRPFTPKMLRVPFRRFVNPVVRDDLKLDDETMMRLEVLDVRIQRANRDLNYATAYLHRHPKEEMNMDDMFHYLIRTNDEYWAALPKELNESQLNRIRQIQFQFDGTDSLLSREFRVGANLSDDQIGAILQIIRDQKPGRRTPRRRDNPPTEDDLRDEVTSAQETIKQALESLNENQRTVWQQLTGKPLPIEGLYDFDPPEKP